MPETKQLQNGNEYPTINFLSNSSKMIFLTVFLLRLFKLSGIILLQKLLING